MGRINVGDRVKARINGFEGIVSVKSEHLFGCDRVYIQPEKLAKDGKEVEGIWIDEPWVDVIKEAVYTRTPTFSPKKVARTGGPVSAPPDNRDKR